MASAHHRPTRRRQAAKILKVCELNELNELNEGVRPPVGRIANAIIIIPIIRRQNKECGCNFADSNNSPTT